MDAWTSAVHRRRYLVVLTWVAVVTLAAGRAVRRRSGSKLADLLSNRFDLPGTESAKAQTILQKHFSERDDSSFTVVFQPDRDRAGRPRRRRALARRSRPPPPATA